MRSEYDFSNATRNPYVKLDKRMLITKPHPHIRRSNPASRISLAANQADGVTKPTGSRR